MGLKFRRGIVGDYIFILQPQHICMIKDCSKSLLNSEMLRSMELVKKVLLEQRE